MTSDYAKITEENVTDRGKKFEDIGNFFAEQFYSDQTHFVYELLQNAQDALNRRIQAQPGTKFPQNVTFSLFPDRLEFRHYGQLFNEMDVRGISDILKGTKVGDKKQIGRFGIGFKSVYAFTRSPEVHSGDEHFVIKQYIRPEAVEPKVTKPDETLFIFPFDHPDKKADETFQRIQKRLVELGLRTLLFLDQIDQIVWEVDGKRMGAYIRTIRPLPNLQDCYYVSILGEEANSSKKKMEERWLVFERKITETGGHTSVEIAYLFEMDKEGAKGHLVPADQSRLFAYFQTEKETHLGFMIQGHYNTTPARDNIQYDDEHNRRLIAETAHLIIDSLQALKSSGLLTAKVLEMLPLEEANFPPGTFFRPLYEEVKKALSTHPLFPAAGGGFIKAEEAKLARGTELIELLKNEQLKALFAIGKDYKWLSDEITNDKTPGLRQYLMRKLDVEEIDAERFGRNIDEKFLVAQSEEWLIKFYKYLNGQQAIWRKKISRGQDEGVLRNKPFILCEDGNFVKPFDLSGIPQVYLPPSDETDFPIVKRSLVQDELVLNFFNNLGLDEPDLVDEVITYTLPKYPYNGECQVKEEEHIKDIKRIFHALDTCSAAKREILVKKLQAAKFLQAINVANGKKSYLYPRQIYIDNPAMRDYFENNPEIWFYDPTYIPFRKQLEIIGVRKEIEMVSVRVERNGHATIKNWWGDHVRGLDGFDYRWNVDGLSFAVENPTLKRAKIIWNNFLVPNSQLVRGTIESSNKQDFPDPKREERFSIAGDLVCKTKWLPDRSGEFHLPGELSLDDLPEDFARNEKLADQLWMKVAAVSVLAKDQGIDETLLNLAIQLVKQDPDSLRNLATRVLQTRSFSDEEADFNYSRALQDAFDEKASDENLPEPEPAEHPDPVPDPEHRRKKTQEELERDKTYEPPVSERFGIVPSSVWEAKNNSIRPFLLEQYGGRCQICGFTFYKRNGEPYFEGLYLVSRLHKKWIDRTGNVLCLCANCCAKMQHGIVKVEDLVGQVKNVKLQSQVGTNDPTLIIELCGETLEIRYTDRHIIDLQEMIKSEDQQNDVNEYID